MMKRYRIAACLLALLLLTVSVSAAPLLPYSIEVNTAANTVTVYTTDEAGEYTVPVKAMICSTARSGYVTPTGNFRLTAFRSPWRLMVDGTYGQYATCFQGNYLFHSICYADDSHDAMIREAYNDLGNPASMGCVRLQTIDAKWIYDNCPAGTPVRIYDDPDDPGPLGKPEKLVDEITPQMHNGWDPTDPADGNPWVFTKAEKIKIKPSKVKLTAGETYVPQVQAEPEDAVIVWKSSDDTVAKVSADGTIMALSAGKTVITAYGEENVKSSCTVTVTGQLLPYKDLDPKAWYYDELKAAVEKGLFSGVSEELFAPDSSMTRAMAVQVLYNMEKKPGEAQEPGFEDVRETDWYYDAVAWAVESGIVTGISETRFAPDRPLTRQDLAMILWRYAGSPETKGTLDHFSDADAVAVYAGQAMAWAVEEGLMQGENQMLMPKKTATRVQTAVIMQRFFQ